MKAVDKRDQNVEKTDEKNKAKELKKKMLYGETSSSLKPNRTEIPRYQITKELDLLFSFFNLQRKR